MEGPIWFGDQKQTTVIARWWRVQDRFDGSGFQRHLQSLKKVWGFVVAAEFQWVRKKRWSIIAEGYYYALGDFPYNFRKFWKEFRPLGLVEGQLSPTGNGSVLSSLTATCAPPFLGMIEGTRLLIVFAVRVFSSRPWSSSGWKIGFRLWGCLVLMLGLKITFWGGSMLPVWGLFTLVFRCRGLGRVNMVSWPRGLAIWIPGPWRWKGIQQVLVS